MNIYTVTFIQNNYGSVLQAYSLQQKLKEYGCYPVILIKAGSNGRRTIYERFVALMGFVRYLCTPMLDYSLLDRLKLKLDEKKFYPKYEKINAFLKQNLELQVIENEEQFIKSLNGNAVFIAGSDQIWSIVGKPLSPWFTLQWIKGKQYLKYSYAASLGNTKLTEEDKAIYCNSLSEFQCISLRESQAVNALRPFFNKKLRQDIDPTLLYDISFWKEKISQRAEKEHYVFIYRLRPDNNVISIARQLAKRYKCKIIYTGLYSCDDKDVECIYDAGVEEFLSYIFYSDYVVTNSFHGTVFSIIFHKYFLSVKVSHTGTRAESLLTLLGLKSQYIENAEDSYSFEIDYSEVDKRLQVERENSLKYIERICKKD